jgi:hypothetical protein
MTRTNIAADHRMREGRVEALGERVGGAAHGSAPPTLRSTVIGPLCQLVDAAVGRGRQAPGITARWPRAGPKGRAQFVEADAPASHHRNDRAADRLRQRGGVECESPALREVDHVEGHDRRQAAREDLARQHQVSREVARVDDHDDRVWRAVRADAGEDVTAEPRLRHVEMQLVQARQVDDLGGGASVGQQAPVADAGRGAGKFEVLARAPQPVEQRGLAGVGCEQGDA